MPFLRVPGSTGGGGGGSGSLSTLQWGAGSIGSTTTVRYLYPDYDDGLAQTAAIEFEAPFTGTLSDLRIVHNIPGGNGATVTYTVYVGGVATALILSALANSAGGANTINTAAVTAGDKIRIEITKGAVIVGGATMDVTASAKLTAA